jgi:signal transduction histidine kinase
VLLASSFLMLISFGVRLITGPMSSSFRWSLYSTIIAVWVIGLFLVSGRQNFPAQVASADVYTRYALAIPGAALSVWGLILQKRRFMDMGMPAFGKDVVIAALAFGLYGGIGQLFATPSSIFPSEYLNAEIFLRWFGFPIQVFRASMAMVAATFIIRSMRAFDVENNRRLEALNAAQQAERQRLEALRGELLHRTVKAQESERQRIARELHDETGQTLTALGMGLRGLSDSIPENPQRAAQQAKQLEGLAVSGVEELQRLISGLHPPQLDDLGLMAALRWYGNEIKTRYGLPVTVSNQGTPVVLPVEVRTVFFRIAQEAITNAIRHASATQASISLESTPQQLLLEVSDNGNGFDVADTLESAARPSWGLLGMMERATLIGGECQIVSQPGSGTRVRVSLLLEGHADG